MSLPCYAIKAAQRIAAKSGAKVDDVIAAYRAAAKGTAVNASSLFLKNGVITSFRAGARSLQKERP